MLIVFLAGCAADGHIETQVNIDTSLIEKEKLLKDLAFISSDKLKGRKIGKQGSLLAQEYIENSLELSGVSRFNGKFKHSFALKSHEGNNIIGIVLGKIKNGKYIVLTAHYDHLGSRGNIVFNGADDNASGVSALLSIAKEIAEKPLKSTVIFLFTDGEEINLLGSKAFISQNPDVIKKTALNINIDMISGESRTKSLHYISQNLSTISTAKMNMLNLITVDDKFFSVRRGFRGTEKRHKSIYNRTNCEMASDHGVFYKANVPFIYYGVGVHKNYHSENDTFENANLLFFHKSVNFIYMQLKHIDNQLL